MTTEATVFTGNHNLREFVQHVKDAPTTPFSERVVRLTVAGVASNAPIDVLVQLAETVIRCRQGELRDEAERN